MALSPRRACSTPEDWAACSADLKWTTSPPRARSRTTPRDGLLYAVNAGSNTISVFAVYGDQLALRQVISSGGAFPVSIAVSHGLVYVLNAEEGGSVQGYALQFGHLVAIPGSNRALGLNPSATPQFTNTPGQVAFSPNGQQLIVTTKENGSDIDVFQVTGYGRLSARLW